jgi:DNA gyrase inhibitor GyrI
MPAYEIIFKKQKYEIRHYREYIVAETRRQGRPAEAMTSGFNELFRYISGENVSQSKITMTAPILGFTE